MNALIKYLSDIADALEGLAKDGAGKSKAGTSSSSSSSSSSVTAIGVMDTTDINATLEDALVVTTEEEQEGQTVENRTSVYNVIAQDIAATIHSAFFITVSETQDDQTVQVEKPVLDVIRQDLYDMRNSEALTDESNNGD